jgi:hypothetical protein
MGQLSIMKLLQLEFTDVSWGLTFDDVAAAERSFLCCKIVVPWKELQPQADANFKDAHPSLWAGFFLLYHVFGNLLFL